MSTTQADEYLIIGAGPAGLQSGYVLEQGGHDDLILEERGRVGAFFTRYPQSRTLISCNRAFSIYDDPEIVLRRDWNSLLTHTDKLPFRDYSRDLYPQAEDMAFVAHYALNRQYHRQGVRIEKDARGECFPVDTRQDTCSCRSLILATGLSQPWIPGIPGIELAEGYKDASMNPGDFPGRWVLIIGIGKGYAGFEMADVLLDTASLIHIARPHPLRLAWNTRHPGHLRANSIRFLDIYHFKLLKDCAINYIMPRGGQLAVSVTYSHAQVIRCTGFQVDTSIFDDICAPPRTPDHKLLELAAAWESPTARGLFVAGHSCRPGITRSPLRPFSMDFATTFARCTTFLKAGATINRCLAARVWQPRARAWRTGSSNGSAAPQRCGHSSACSAMSLSWTSTRTGSCRLHMCRKASWGSALTLPSFPMSGSPGQTPRSLSAQREGRAKRLSSPCHQVRHVAGSQVLAEHHVLEDLCGMYCQEHTMTAVASTIIWKNTNAPLPVFCQAGKGAVLRAPLWHHTESWKR